jgi:hypothetical protein
MLGTALGEVPPCAGDHCSRQSVQQHVNEVCKQNDWPVGHHVLVKGSDNKWCYCTCSCLAFGSPVQATSTSTQQIQEFKLNSPVYATDLNFNWQQLNVADVIGTEQIGQPNTVFIAYDGGSLTVTADHLFLVGGKKLIAAQYLTNNDTLTSPSGAAVKITSVNQGDFFGSFHNVATSSTSDPKTNPNGHLINTNGVISGDYALQTQYLGNTIDPSLLHPEAKSRPPVGSVAYHEQFPYADPTPQAVEAASKLGVKLSAAGETGPGILVVRREHDDEFDDLASMSVLGFVPLHHVGPLERLPAYPFSDGQRKALGDYLCKLFGAFYPDIEFSVCWYRRNVNVYALAPLLLGGKKRVVISGGFLRTKMLDVGSISLAMAFAVTSLEASPDDARNIGYDDFNGAAIVMRNVWWDVDYITRMEAAMKELKDLFTYIPVGFGFETNPIYPSGQCRLDTYENAMTMTGIPACAENMK